jgi:hypothetical protein
MKCKPLCNNSILKVSNNGFFNWAVDSGDLLFAAVGHPAEVGRSNVNVGSMWD